MPQVRALAADRLRGLATAVGAPGKDRPSAAHAALLARDIERFLSRPGAVATSPAIPAIPPGPPIGEPPMDWLRGPEPYCSLEAIRER
jgi:hypothetical protein